VLTVFRDHLKSSEIILDSLTLKKEALWPTQTVCKYLPVEKVQYPGRLEYSLLYRYIKRKISPVTGLEWPRGYQEVKVPRFHDSMDVDEERRTSSANFLKENI